MKLLVSDYDNTFHINDCDMNENIKATKEFMKNNLFVIATGRCYDSYMKQQNLFNIKTSYLIINHGATILKDDKVIINKTIDNDLKNKIINNLDLTNVNNIYGYKEKQTVNVNEYNLTKILIEYKTENEAIDTKKMLEKQYKNINIFKFGSSIEIISGNVDKAYAINKIIDIEKINHVYVIGDSYNDYQMIKKYNGYCTNIAINEVKEISQKQYKNVSDLIWEII